MYYIKRETIFSLFYNEKFVTTDLSACMDSRFDKLVMSKIQEIKSLAN